MSSIDVKSSRAFVKAVTNHLQKLLRADEGKDPVALVTEIDRCVSMIKFAASTNKQKKKSKKAKKKAAAGSEAVVAPEPAST